MTVLSTLLTTYFRPINAHVLEFDVVSAYVFFYKLGQDGL